MLQKIIPLGAWSTSKPKIRTIKREMTFSHVDLTDQPAPKKTSSTVVVTTYRKAYSFARLTYIYMGRMPIKDTIGNKEKEGPPSWKNSLCI